MHCIVQCFGEYFLANSTLEVHAVSSERKDAVCTEGDDTAEGAGGGGDEENVGFGAIWWWW